jgi:hypothetical protein
VKGEKILLGLDLAMAFPFGWQLLPGIPGLLLILEGSSE